MPRPPHHSAGEMINEVDYHTEKGEKRVEQSDRQAEGKAVLGALGGGSRHVNL